MSYFGSQAKRLGRKVEKEKVEITKDRKNRRTKGRQKKEMEKKVQETYIVHTVTKRSKKNWQKSQKPIKRTEK